MRWARVLSVVLASCTETNVPCTEDCALALDAGGGCAADSECDDGLFCNGAETCSEGACAAGASPCDDCVEETDPCGSCATGTDVDGDGHDSLACGGDDCDDTDALSFPGNAEICDAGDRDEDCDPSTFGFRDVDGDSVADSQCCNVDGSGTSTCGTDCDDTTPAAHPRQAEVCDGIDNDCDSLIDDGVLETFYVDADGDRHGSDAAGAPTMEACEEPPGYSNVNDDCDDSMPSVYFMAPELCTMPAADEDCDGTANEDCECTAGEMEPCPQPGVCGTGQRTCVGGMWGACPITPTTETCDGRDEDCDGNIDEATNTCRIDGVCYAAGTANGSCQVCDPVASPTSWTNRPVTTRCDDGGAATCGFCDASGACSARDTCNDMRSCTSDVCDDATGMCRAPINPGFCLIGGTCYMNGAANGACRYCDSGTPTQWTNRPTSTPCDDGAAISCGRCNTSGSCATSVSCNDGNSCTTDSCPADMMCTNPAMSAGSTCDDGVSTNCDDTCNGSGVCSGVPRTTYYRDADGDGYGTTFSMSACSRPPGYADRTGDCLDSNPDVHPNASYQTSPYLVCPSGTVLCSPVGGCTGSRCRPSGDLCVCTQPAPSSSWDYDCSGGPNLEPVPVAAACRCCDLTTCVGCDGGGYTGSLCTTCGCSYTYRGCGSICGSCAAQASTSRMRGCR